MALTGLEGRGLRSREVGEKWKLPLKDQNKGWQQGRQTSAGSGQLNSVAKDRWEHEESHVTRTWEKNREKVLTAKDNAPVGG